MYHVRAIGRTLLTWYYARLADLEDWWRAHVVAAEPRPHLVLGIPWVGETRPRYKDGPADVYVSDGAGAEQVETYLNLIHHPTPREVR